MTSLSDSKPSFDDISQALPKFFARAKNIVGTEYTYRALLYERLRELGYEANDVVAELRTAEGRVAISINHHAGARHLIELKSRVAPTADNTRYIAN